MPYSGSGGGGGYFGGGGGGGPAVSGSDPTPGAGGGGSGFLHASFTATTLTAGGGPVTTPAATDGVVAISYISPPAAPNPATPGTGSNQDATAIIALSWTNPATPEAGDTITAFDVQYRVVGTPNWTAVTRQVTANTFYNLPANTFVPGAAVEWQVRSVGSMSGNAGPWSQSFFFNPIAPPDAPNVTLPVAAQAVTVSPINSRWDIVTGQQQFQVRRTSATVPGTIYWDSGPIVSNVNYYNGIPFTAAVRTEHVQVRVMVNGLWSGWSDTSVNVNIAPPNAPTLNAVADNSTASILVTITNPGGGGNPAAVYNDLYRSSPYDSEIRIATLLAVNGAFLDYTPGHNVPYTYRAVAIAANGAGASS